MVAAGIARLGRYTRFVAHSVMIGFLTGISANIVFGQIPDLLGYQAEGSFNLAKAVDSLLHLQLSQLPSLLTGISAIVITVILGRTKIGWAEF
jgi:SulP family sulfate permease